MAFSNASLVMIWRGRIPARSSSTTAWPDARAASSRRRSTAGADELPGSDMPRASATEAMVLAVNIPAHEPSVGHALCSMSESSVVGEGVDGVGTDRLEHRRDVDGPVADPAGEDRPAVEEDAREVETGGGHQHARQRLVAAGQGDHAVEALGVHDGLDRVGDHLAADQRRPHPLVAHGDAVGHRDGDELERESAGLTHAVLGLLGQPGERQVARRHLVPRRGHADLGLVPVVVTHADRTQHGAGRGTGRAVGDGEAAGLDAHEGLLGRVAACGAVAHPTMVRRTVRVGGRPPFRPLRGPGADEPGAGAPGSSGPASLLADQLRNAWP